MAKVDNFTNGRCMLKLSPRELFFHKNGQRSGMGLQMMTYSAGSSDTYKLSVLRSEFWLLFRARVECITFYDVLIG